MLKHLYFSDLAPFNEKSPLGETQAIQIEHESN